MSGSIHISDDGTIHRITIKDQNSAVVDLSGATTMEITYRRPDGTTFVETAVLYTDGSDGKVDVTLTTVHLNQSGTYKWQGYFVFSTGSWHTKVQSFVVQKNV